MLQNITSSNFNCSGVDGAYPLGSNCYSKTNSYSSETLESLNFLIYFANQTNDNYVYIPLLSLAVDNNVTANGLGVYCTNSSSNNTVIVGTTFYNNFLPLYFIDYSNPLSDYLVIYTNGDTAYDAYIGNAPIVTNPTNPFIPSSGDDEEGLEEGVIYGIVGGAALLLLIILIVFTIYKKR